MLSYAFVVVFVSVLCGGLAYVGWQLMTGVGPIENGVTVVGTVADTEFVERAIGTGSGTRTEWVALDVIQFNDPETGMTHLVTGYDAEDPPAFGASREVSLLPGAPETARVLLDPSPTAGLVLLSLAGLVLLFALWRVAKLVTLIRLLT